MENSWVAGMFGDSAENELKNLLDDALDHLSAAERVEIVRAMSCIALHYDAAAAGVQGMLAECNPALVEQSWDAAQRVIQAAMQGRGDRR